MWNQIHTLSIKSSSPLDKFKIKNMKNPQPNQIQHHKLGGELRFLFTKTLDSDDVLGLTLIGDSKNYLQGLPKPLLDEITTRGLGLDIEVCTSNMTHWLTIYHERASNNFKLKKTNNWVDLLTRSGIKIGEKIDCWALYNAEKDPNGILRLLIEKVSDFFL
jgi:hypothetical protein